MKLKIVIVSGLLALVLFPLSARADRRSFTRAYEVATQPEGNLEAEIWADLETPKDRFADSLITQRVELEYGLTDHWDVSLYNVFTQGGPAAGGDTGFKFDSWRVETRYRLLEKNELPVDVMFYLEVERPADFREPAELEEKIILGKDIGRFGAVLNLVGEQKLGTGARSGHNWELDLGARYEVVPALRVGVDAWSIRELDSAGTPTVSHFAGPSINLATRRLWLQVGAGFGLGDTDHHFLRSVIGFNL